MATLQESATPAISSPPPITSSHGCVETPNGSIGAAGPFWAALVISLQRTPERYAAFRERWPVMLPQPGLWVAFDGTANPPPEEWFPKSKWKSSDLSRNGAWGCWQSHTRILQWAIDNGVEYQDKPLAVFEDDAQIVAPERIAKYLTDLPDDWQIAYLGCQHEKPFEIVKPGILRCFGPGRTHAMLIRPSFVRQLLELWLANDRHVDWTLRDNAERYRFYAPLPIIAIQMTNQSQIVGVHQAARDWNPERRAPIVLLKCPAEVLIALKERELAHTGFDPIPETGVSACLENICSNFMGNDKPVQQPDGTYGPNSFDAIGHLAFAQYLAGSPTQVGIRIEANMMPRAVCAVWNPAYDVFKFKIVVPRAYMVDAANLDDAISQIEAILKTADTNAVSSNVRHFVHSGKLGDIIYALPAIREMGGGRLTITPSDEVGKRMTQADADSLRPLLLAQPYITEVDFAERVDTPVINLNYWRMYGKVGKNIAEFVLGRFGKDLRAASYPWLMVEPRRYASVVINRTSSYQGIGFPWEKIVQKYTDAVFVGARSEWNAFRLEFGNIRYLETPNLLELARVIAGADLFCGNQSCSLAIAEGLKKRALIETFNGPLATHQFPRADAFYGGDVLPEPVR